MKPILFEYQISRDQWVTGLMAVLARYSADDPYRSRLVIARLVGLVLLVFLWQLAGWSSWSLFAAAVLLPLGEAMIRRTFGRQAIGSTFDPGESSIRLEVDEDGLHERSANRERRYLWSGVRGVYETGEVIVFDLAGTDMLAIPGEAIAKDQRDALDAALAEHNLALIDRSPLDARSGVGLSDTATVAKLSVGVAIVGAAVGWATSGSVLAATPPDLVARNVLSALAGGLLLAAVAWIAVGRLLGVVARRSATAASIAAWLLVGASLIAFLFGFIWR